MISLCWAKMHRNLNICWTAWWLEQRSICEAAFPVAQLWHPAPYQGNVIQCHILWCSLEMRDLISVPWGCLVTLYILSWIPLKHCSSLAGILDWQWRGRSSCVGWTVSPSDQGNSSRSPLTYWILFAYTFPLFDLSYFICTGWARLK